MPQCLIMLDGLKIYAWAYYHFYGFLSWYSFLYLTCLQYQYQCYHDDFEWQLELFDSSLVINQLIYFFQLEGMTQMIFENYEMYFIRDH